MTLTEQSIWYLEWAKNFRIVVDSECGAPARRYICIHVASTGLSRVWSNICVIHWPGRCTPWPVGHTGHWGVPFRTYTIRHHTYFTSQKSRTTCRNRVLWLSFAPSASHKSGLNERIYRIRLSRR